MESRSACDCNLDSQKNFNGLNSKKEQHGPDNISYINPHNKAHGFDGTIDVEKENEDFIPDDIKVENQIKSEFDMPRDVDFKIEYDRDCISPEGSETQNNQEDPNVCEMEERGSFSCWICFKSFTACLDVKKHILQEHDQKALCALIKAGSEDFNTFPSQFLLFCPKNCEFVTSKLDVLSLHLAYCPEPVVHREGRDFIEIQNHFISNHYELLKEKCGSEESRRQNGPVDVEVEIKEEDTHTFHHTTQRADNALSEDHLYKSYSEDVETVTQQTGQQEGTAGQADGRDMKDFSDKYSCRMHSPLSSSSKQLEHLKTNFNPEVSCDGNSKLTHDNPYGCAEVNRTVKHSEFDCTRNHPSCCVEVEMAADVLKFEIQVRCEELGEHCQDELNDHMGLHKEEITFLCERCGKTFRKRRCLLVHKGIRSGVTFYACNVCSKIFNSSSVLERHMDKIHRVCKECGKSFLLPSELLVHTSLHTGEKSNACTVCTLKFCEKKGVTIHNLGRNQLAVHSRPPTRKKPFECAECGEKLRKSRSLHWHVRIRRGQKLYECWKCGNRYAEKSNHFKHMRSRWKGMPYDFSGIRLSQENNHNKHVIPKSCKVTIDCNKSVLGSSYKSQPEESVDPGKTNFVCNGCGKRFCDRTRLLVHMKAHRKTKFYCNHCGKMFCNRIRLFLHLRVHTGQSPFICDQCGQRFSLKSNLSVHMRGHMGDSPYSCIECDKEFRHSSICKKHKRMHMRNQSHQRVKSQLFELRRTYSADKWSVYGEKAESLSQREMPFQCFHCEKRFHDKDSLLMHINSSNLQLYMRACGCGKLGKNDNSECLDHIKLDPDAGPSVDRFTEECLRKLFGGQAVHREESEEKCWNERDLNKPIGTRTGDGSFQCEDLSKSFKHENDPTKQMKTQTLKKPFHCKECNKSCWNTKDLLTHMRTHTGEKPFHCEKCEKRFADRSNLRTHMRAHSGRRPCKCEECGKSFMYNSNLQNHMRTHTGDKSFQCEECEKTFYTNSSLHNHMITHTGVKLFQCEACGKSYRDRATLFRHMRSHDTCPKVKPFQCKECGKSFGGRRNLQCHMRTHTGERPFQCEECKRGFGDRVDLVRHMRIHTGEKPFQCVECEKSFGFKSSLRNHLRTHIRDKQFQCEECGKSFRNRISLQVHMTDHTGEKPHQCEACGKTFGSKTILKNHVRTHTGEKPYQCEECTKSYRDKSSLQIHMRTHTGEKPFQCEECTKRFGKKNDLYSHMRTHTREKIFQCEKCDKKFALKSYLKRHDKIHRKDVFGKKKRS